MIRQHLAASAVAVALASATLALPATARAGDGQEKCFGIAKAGKNQCQSKAHSCAGQSKTDFEPDTWIWTPQGTCDRIVGASLFTGKGGSAGYNRKDWR